MHSFAPFVNLRINDQIVHTTFTPFNYMNYLNNINCICRRHNPRVTLKLFAEEIEGVESMSVLVEKAKEEYINAHPSYEPYKQEYIAIGETLVDINRYNPDILVAYGYRIVVNNGEIDSIAFKDVQVNSYILLDTTKTMLYKSTVIPGSWISSIIQYCLDEGESLNDGFLFKDLAQLPQGESVNRQISDIKQELIDKLFNLYIRGTIALSGNIHKDFIRRWELSVGAYTGLYHPNWKNTLITQDQTKYLHDALSDSNLSYMGVLRHLYTKL